MVSSYHFTYSYRHTNKLSYYAFCIRWLFKYRHWDNNRHKFKAMDRDYDKHIAERKRRRGMRR